MRAVVTGGAGFIGSNLVDALVERGDEVTAIDNLSTGRRDNLAGALERGVRLVEADIRDGAAMREVIGAAQPEVVFHLAAQIDVRKSVADPATDAAINVLGTVNVLDAARDAGARRVVNTSSGGAIYGEAQQMPAPESHPIVPEAPYGLSKYCAEQYCEIYTRMHGLSVVSLRYGNVYGPRQDPLGEAGVIAIFCGKLVDSSQPVVFGDGLQTRDYVFIGDVVASNLAAADADGTGAFNIGTGVESTVLDIVDALAPHAPGTFEAQHEPERPGEIRHIALDPSLAREKLGWEPRTNLSDGLGVTLESLR